MIKHVVMWRFKEESKQENMAKTREMLLALPEVIPEIKRMEVFFDTLHSEMSYDLMLETEFETMEALNTYVVHPEHQKVSKFVRSVIETRVSLDAEI